MKHTGWKFLSRWMGRWQRLWQACSLTISVNGVVIETPVTITILKRVIFPQEMCVSLDICPWMTSWKKSASDLLEALWYIGRIRELPEPVFRKIEEENWMESWKQHYHPIRLGEKLLILPAWIPEDRPWQNYHSD